MPHTTIILKSPRVRTTIASIIIWEVYSIMIYHLNLLIIHIQKILLPLPGVHWMMIHSKPWQIQGKSGKIPIWWKIPWPVLTSNKSKARTANIAALPFHVSALFVQPHSQTVTGGGSCLLWASYVASSSSTLPRGINDCEKKQNTNQAMVLLSRGGEL